MKGEYYAAIKKRCGYYLRKINMKLKVIKEHLGKMYRYIHAYISTRKNWEAIHQNLDSSRITADFFTFSLIHFFIIEYLVLVHGGGIANLIWKEWDKSSHPGS